MVQSSCGEDPRVYRIFCFVLERLPAVRADVGEVNDLEADRTVIGESSLEMPSGNTSAIAQRVSVAGNRAYETGASRLSDLAVVPGRRDNANASTRAIEVDRDATKAPVAPIRSTPPAESATKIVSSSTPLSANDLANESTRLGAPLSAPSAQAAPRPGVGAARPITGVAAGLVPPRPMMPPQPSAPMSPIGQPNPFSSPPTQIAPPAQHAHPPVNTPGAMHGSFQQPGLAPAAPPAPNAGASASAPAANNSPFAAPPPPDADATSRAMANLTAKFAAIGQEPKFSVAPRTWLLSALVVAILIAFVLPTFKPAEVPPAPRPRPTAEAVVPVAPPVSVSALGVVGQPRPAQPNVPNPPTQRAADLLIAGRWQDALTHYEALALAEPTNPAYAKIAQVLRRRIAEQCLDGVNARGEPCEVSP